MTFAPEEILERVEKIDQKELPLIISLFCVVFLAIFNFSITLMASSYIESDLGGGRDISTYSTTFYGIGNAISIPLGKQLAKRFGTVKIFIICLCLFSFFSWLCTAAVNFPLLVATRFIHGLVSGPFYSLGQNLMSVHVPDKKKPLVNSILVTFFAIVPALGASWGGTIAYLYDWRWIFYPNIPLPLIVAVYLWFRWRKTDTVQSCPPFDGLGYFSYFLGIFCLAVSCITGQQLDWFRSPLYVSMLSVGAFSLVFFIIWSLFQQDPILNFHLLKKRIFAFTLVNICLLFSAYFGTIVLLSLWLNLYVNYTPLWIALLFLIMCIAGFFPTPLVEGRFSLIDCRIPLCLAIALLALSSFHTTTFNVEINFGRVAFSRFIAGCGLAIFLPPLFRMSFHSFPTEKSADVMELFQVMRSLSSALGAAFYTTLWLRRQVFFHERLGEKLTAFSTETKTYFAKAKNIYLKGDHALAQLNTYLDRQSTALALDDCFYLMAWILTTLLIICLFTYLGKKDPFYPERIPDGRP
jgi:MFS transporter, DHA2 family, multidrug resistance protein